MASKDNTTKSESKTTSTAPAAFDVTIDEFCIRLSATDTRVEMIGAFCADEKRHSRIKDSDANFTKRFGEFVKRPVLD